MMTISQAIQAFARQHEVERAGPFGLSDNTRLLTEFLPSALHSMTGLDRRGYKIYGSVGRIHWAEIPWMAILDRSITESTRYGHYIVFLFDQPLERVYLCLSLGWVQFAAQYGSKAGRLRAQQQAAGYAGQLGVVDGFDAGLIDLQAQKELGKGYEVSIVINKPYRLDELDDDLLKANIAQLMQAYGNLNLLLNL